MRSLSRRALLRGGALGVAAVVAAGCAAEEPERLRAEPPDPETVLLRQLIAGKEQAVALYSSAASAKLAPFRERHEAHLAELRRRLPPDATPAPASPGTPSPSASGTPAPGAKASLRSLQRLEQKAAALRPRQLDGVSPALAQLIASIGACEAAHAVALSRLL
ncbi:exonuclease SbcC [Streptosporangium roseum]|uniref:Exonuclease SbcC n=1 Tax=Streptosporangium roseum (strain ATCC 12428 / DSM 43021 / JCM 3005 / KCTC 9067 / NCIMB 10171 / NRRL 2505 / NI 9100) TaxID=479432 RepID=D2AXS7_STRRD|nr:exonuclease SbcC [Streptosporangium roseum]ACZ85098.1 exonuclease SbcC [Streptosporangium roseum DSM 43021]